MAYKNNIGNCNLVVPCNDIKTVTEKFNYIHNYFQEGENVFVIEDDIKEFVALNSATKKVTKLTNLDFINKGFEYCNKTGTKLFGIVPHDNGFYMANKVTNNLKLIVAHAYGFISDHSRELNVTQIGKSDYERTILYFLKFGGVIRFNYIGVTTKSYTTEGGMDKKESRYKQELDSCEYLVKRYPHFIKHNIKKESLYKELLFRPVKNNKNYWQTIQALHDVKIGSNEQTKG